MAGYGYDDALAYWRARNIQTDADLDAVVDGRAVTFAYHTTRLEEPEVTYNDTREIFEHGRVTGYTGDLKTLFALQNAKNGWELLLRTFANRRPLSEELIKEFHYILTVGTYEERRFLLGERPGEYKKGDYVTGRFEVGAPPEDVPEEIRELLEDIKDVPEDKALTAAAFFHAKFENIHAFADGNGCVGRLLMNYFLVCHNHPVITIHVEDRAGYMEALEAWDEHQELEPLKTLLKEQTVKTWEQTGGRRLF